MAKHLDILSKDTVPAVFTKAQLYQNCRHGDLVFCSSRDILSLGIERITGSAFSHVLMIWLPWQSCPEWLTLESTDDRGVHVGRFTNYVDAYNGPLLLCRRPALTPQQITEQLNTGFSLLDYKYNFIEEGSMAIRKIGIFSMLPDIKPEKQLFCSGLMQAISLKTLPYQTYGIDWNTPEQNFIDPSVEIVGAFLA